jgi:hypothetical protein
MMPTLSFPRAAAMRLALFPGEALRLPRACRGVCVWAGKAWLSQAGRDVRLGPGEALTLAPGRDPAVVSALGDWALILELNDSARAGAGGRRPGWLPRRK